MNRLNRYARTGSVLGLLPNPLTRVDLSPLRPEPPRPAGTNPPSGSSPPAQGGKK